MWVYLVTAGVHHLAEGARALGTVLKVVPQTGLVLTLPCGRTGFVSLVDLADSYRPNPLEYYSEGQLVRLVGHLLTNTFTVVSLHT